MDVARALVAIPGAVAAGTEMSRTRGTDPAAPAALDYGLPQRALIALSGRSMGRNFEHNSEVDLDVGTDMAMGVLRGAPVTVHPDRKATSAPRRSGVLTG
ncbi:hypothetical protein ACGFMM_35660 [Streptomyces sp. NPDC048604]|uniref:hypothetical protein n=1 Tax=Streptomyces sp. NPDC048604 TaxID=3365578 RepID=UPI00370F9A67